MKTACVGCAAEAAARWCVCPAERALARPCQLYLPGRPRCLSLYSPSIPWSSPPHPPYPCRPHSFKIAYSVALHGELLRTDMRVLNTGDTPFDFTAALHSYIEVLDVEKAAVRGLKGLEYLDKVGGMLGWEGGISRHGWRAICDSCCNLVTLRAAPTPFKCVAVPRTACFAPPSPPTPKSPLLATHLPTPPGP